MPARMNEKHFQLLWCEALRFSSTSWFPKISVNLSDSSVHLPSPRTRSAGTQSSSLTAAISLFWKHRMNTHHGEPPEDENQEAVSLPEEGTDCWGQAGRDMFGDFRNPVCHDILVKADILLLVNDTLRNGVHVPCPPGVYSLMKEIGIKVLISTKSVLKC